ncbi:N,N-dimethylformamidase beta subunit family domain-containing protein [Geodermatophilus sp. CPCC 206100]|uniref:N,N-dimethylformamidase beta subunit family domain-containing protein n=1 Tax=Geodermatophilus sp. CPCC 206100 TaxID=3020054 RepID=UPI003B00CA2D
MNVIGYVDRLSSEPGEVVRGRFSTPAESFTARLVRLVLGDPHPLGPGPDIRPVPSALDGARFPGRVQPLRAGSSVRTAESPLPPGTVRLDLTAAVRPTLPRAGHRQTVVSLTQEGVPVVAAALDEDGAISLCGACGPTAAGPVVSGRWYRMTLAVDVASGAAELELTSDQGDRLLASTAVRLDAAGPVGVVFAATAARDAVPTDHFNGRIDSPTLRATPGADPAEGRLVAAWDFGPSSGSLRTVANRLGDTFAGHSVNFPLRACLGMAGAADDVDPRLAPEAYNAIHFHDDDLDDANWADDVVLELPADLPSGVYGIHVEASDGTSDTVPFVVVPTTTRHDVVVVLPTLSYLAYSCEHVMADPGARAYLEGVGVEAPPHFGGNKHDEYLVAQGLRSLYDVHTDLSGVCFASSQKPLPNVRHDHRWAAVAGGPTSAHQFSADLHLISWLTRQGYAFDVITDEEVHRQGRDALSPYRVVLTGSHPEYPTTAMVRAYEEYVGGGGRLMYMGGNGFYWVTSIDPERQHTMEIRRTAGIRAWQPEPGEWHHATTGELGGLWRLRGKAPQKLLGVGMASQGFDTNRPYDVVVDPEDPRISFVFDGVDLAAGRIGDFDSMVNGHGAAGVEIDRADAALGTPDDAIVLATATGFSRAYGLDPVEVALPDGCYDGTTSDKVRCDLVLVPKPSGGAVFSTGSIAWCGSLLVDDGDNDVSAVTRNVLDAFLHREELPLRG